MRKEGTSPAITAADFQFFEGLKQQLRIAREHAGLQAISGMVDLAQGLIEIFIGLDGHDRTEDFLAVDFHLGLGAGEHGGFHHETLAAAAAEQARSGADRFVDPADGTNRIAFADERAHVGGFVQRIASFSFFTPSTKRSVNFP